MRYNKAHEPNSWAFCWSFDAAGRSQTHRVRAAAAAREVAPPLADLQPPPRVPVGAALVLAVAAIAWAFKIGVMAGRIPMVVLGLFFVVVAVAGLWRWGRCRPAAVLMLALAALSVFRLYYVLSGPFDLSGDERNTGTGHAAWIGPTRPKDPAWRR